MVYSLDLYLHYVQGCYESVSHPWGRSLLPFPRMLGLRSFLHWPSECLYYLLYLHHYLQGWPYLPYSWCHHRRFGCWGLSRYFGLFWGPPLCLVNGCTSAVNYLLGIRAKTWLPRKEEKTKTLPIKSKWSKMFINFNKHIEMYYT